MLSKFEALTGNCKLRLNLARDTSLGKFAGWGRKERRDKKLDQRLPGNLV